MKKAFNILMLCIVAMIGLSMLCHAADSPSSIPSDLLRAMHQVESSGQLGAILGDNGKALGPFQIHRSYWRDANVPGSYAQCSDYGYSVRVMTAYMRRYAPSALRTGNKEVIARTHNGGPRGAKDNATLGYWARVSKRL